MACSSSSLHLFNTAASVNSGTKSSMVASTSNRCSFTAPQSAKLRGQMGLKAVHWQHPIIVNSLNNNSLLELQVEAEASSTPLKIGIIGLGSFGQFLAKAFQRQGHSVLATSRSDYSQYCQQHGIEYFRQLNDLCDAQPDVLLVCSSILSTEDVVRGIPFHKLKSDTIIADVLSVKGFPKNLLLDVVPSGFGILCTHPMFGKFSGKNSWEGLRFVYDKVRISKDTIQQHKCDQFLSIFGDEGCKMIEMSCEEHDQHAAESQFVTHTVARILSNMDLHPTPIDTKGYETLMELTNNTVSHGSDLYDGLFLYNVNATKQIEKLEAAFDVVKRDLFCKLRENLTRQTEDTTPAEKPMIPSVQFLPSSEKALKDVSSFFMLPEQQQQRQQQQLSSFTLTR